MRNMSDSNRLRTRPTSRPSGEAVAVYARSAADDDVGTACRAQVREALEMLGNPAGSAVYADPRRSGLDADRPALRRLLADIRRGRLRRVIVRDVARLARSATLLRAILDEFRAASVELVTIGEGNRDA